VGVELLAHDGHGSQQLHDGVHKARVAEIPQSDVTVVLTRAQDVIVHVEYVEVW